MTFTPMEMKKKHHPFPYYQHKTRIKPRGQGGLGLDFWQNLKAHRWRNFDIHSLNIYKIHLLVIEK